MQGALVCATFDIVWVELLPRSGFGLLLSMDAILRAASTLAHYSNDRRRYIVVLRCKSKSTQGGPSSAVNVSALGTGRRGNPCSTLLSASPILVLAFA